MILTREKKLEIISEVNKLLIERYVFEEVATEIAEELTSRHKNGSFDKTEDISDYANEIDKIFSEFSNDGHLHLISDSIQLKELIAERELSKQEADQLKQKRINNQRNSNFGFQKLEILEGNIGYLDLRSFCNTDYASETAISAMNFLANTSAIIIDLRYNGGGETEMVILLASYFLGKRVLFNTFEKRYENFIEQYWTQIYSPGTLLKDKDLYILVSGNRTFSAAEDFAYGMQQLKRASIIGETTRGGGHPIELFSILDLLVLWLPTARTINPISKTSWEKVGVKPDVPVSSEMALDTAYKICLEKLINNEKNPENKMFLELSLAQFNSRNKEITIDKNLINQYAGKFGKREFVLEGESLCLKEKNGNLKKLIPLSNDIFAFEDKAFSHICLLYRIDSVTGELLLNFLYTHSREINTETKNQVNNN